MGEIRRRHVLLAALLMALVGAVSAQGLKPFDHAFIIVMENHGSGSIIGDPAMPYVNHLAQTYGYADHYFGVTHPSLPNYIAMTSGSNYFSHSDDPSQMFPHTNLFDQMEQAGLSWKGYMGGLPKPGFTGAQYPVDSKNPLYVNKHDPFVLYPQIKNDPQRMKNVVPLKQLADDLASGQVPALSFIVPDICNDMHGMAGDQCNYGSDTHLKALGNAAIERWVTRIMASKAWTGNSVIFVTWDETDYTGNKATDGWKSAAGGPDSPKLPAGTKLLPAGGTYGGGHVPMIVIAHDHLAHVVSHTPYNHYSLLRTLEQAWSLPYLGYASDGAQVKTLAPLLGGG